MADEHSRLAALAVELAAIVERLGSHPPESPDAITPQQVRALIKARRVRDSYFPQILFADPAWDILLDLFAARLEGREVSVSSACVAAAVPGTTALRWLSKLTEAGLIDREGDESDHRRVFVRLSDRSAEAMAACFEAFAHFQKDCAV